MIEDETREALATEVLHLRQQVDATLRQGEAKFRAIFEQVAVGIAHTTLTGAYVQCNQCYCNMLGFTEAEMRQKTIADITHPDDLPLCIQLIQSTLAGEQSVFSMEKRYICKDGELKWANVTVTLLRNDMGEPESFIAVVEDIHERKQAVQALRASEGRLQALVQQAAVGIIQVSPTGQFIQANQCFCEMLGYTQSEMLGMTFMSITDPEYLPICCRNVDQLLQGAISNFSMEKRYLCKGGQFKWTNVSVSLIRDEFAQPQCLIAVVQDIQEQKQAEEALRLQAQREQALNQVIQLIRQSLDLTTIFSTAVTEITQMLRVDKTTLRQYLPEQRIWHRVAHHQLNPNTCLEPWGVDISDGNSQVLTQLKQLAVIRIDKISALDDEICQGIPEATSYAWLAVPFQVGDRVWGYLSLVRHPGCRSWQDAEVELALAIVAQLAIAIQQSELYHQIHHLNLDLEHQVQARTAQLQLAYEFEATLKRITDRVRDSLDEHQILQNAVQDLAQVLGVDCCNAALFDLKEQVSTICYEYTTTGFPSQGRKSQMADFPELYQQLFQRQHFQFCSLIPNSERGPVAMLACPIEDEQSVMGDLWLVNQSHYIFSEQDIRLVQQVANQCAIALRQARLYRAAQAQVEELERLGRLKDDFLSTVSHELRTPISNIRMAIQMLKTIFMRDETGKIRGQLTPDSPLVVTPASFQKLERYLQILQDECQREINLVNDLLDLSRLEAESESLPLTTLYLKSWLLPLIESFRDRMQKQGQALEIDISESLPAVATDPTALGRIVIELLNNACKYTPADHRITITAQVIQQPQSTWTEQVGFRQAPSSTYPFLQLSVINTGIEISSAEITRIFDKFYRVPNHDPWRHGGTGLGLALVKKLANRLGANIQAHSTEGKTTFTLDLPIVAS